MSEQQPKRELPTIEELVEHMKKYKDAVVILGDEIDEDMKGSLEAMAKEEFTRKNWSKDRSGFWNYYYNNIYSENVEIPEVYKDIKELEDKDLVSKVICINTHGLYENALNLRGVANKIKCSKCFEVIEDRTKEDLSSNEKAKNSCPHCLSRLRPDCLMYKENYHPANIKALADSIFTTDKNNFTTPKTHTLVLAGVNMSENVMAELYDNLLLIRENIDENVYMVMMSVDERDVRTFTPEYATSSDVKGAVKRFKELF